MNKATVALVFILLAVTGCASVPSQQVLASADYGTFPENYKTVIQSYMSGFLKDPQSAQYQYLNKPKKGWSATSGGVFGYTVCARVNAKNSFGGYVGARLNYFMLRDGVIVIHLGGGNNYSVASAKGACSHFI